MKGTKRASTVAIASIGGASVTVGLAHFDGTRVELFDSEHRALPLSERSSEHTGAALKQLLIDAAGALIQRARARGVSAPPQRLYCVFRAPWMHGEVVRVSVDLDQDEIVTEAMLTKLARQALAGSRFANDHTEAHVVEVALNGYPTTRPEGKRAREVALTALISRSDRAVHAGVREALENIFPMSRPTVRSGTRSLLEAIQRARPDLSNYVALDITEEGTLAFLVTAGALRRQIHAPEGIRALFTAVSGASTANDSRTLFSLAARLEGSPSTKEQLLSTLRASKESELTVSYGEMFAALDTIDRLPETLFLVTDPDVAEWFARFFSRADFAQHTVTLRPFQVGVLSLTASSGSHRALSLALPLINKEMRGE